MTPKQQNSLPSRSRETTTTSLEHVPKIDLHRHLLGSARPETLWELAQRYDARRLMWRIGGYKAFRRAIVHSSPPGNLRKYITPWTVFRDLVRSPDDIRRIAAEAAFDAQVDGVCYVEFRTSLPGLGLTDGSAAQTRIAPDEYLAAIRDGFDSVDGIVSRVVAAVTRHAVGPATRNQQQQFANEFFNVVSKFRDLVVGVDLSGLETGWPAAHFKNFFSMARSIALPVTIHAGETEGPAEIWAAVDHLGAKRIGHGTSATRDPKLVRHLIAQGIVLEVCPTAGWLVGAVREKKHHPIIESHEPLLYAICTDNPTLNQSTQTHELDIAAGIAGIDPIVFARQQFATAAKAVFDPRALESFLNARNRPARRVTSQKRRLAR